MKSDLVNKKIFELVLLTLLLTITLIIYTVVTNTLSNSVIITSCFLIAYVFSVLVSYRVTCLTIYKYPHRINFVRILYFILIPNIILIIYILIFFDLSIYEAITLITKILLEMLIILFLLYIQFLKNKHLFNKRGVIIGEKNELDIFLKELLMHNVGKVNLDIYIDTTGMSNLNKNVIDLINEYDYLYILPDIDFNVLNDIIDYCNENEKIAFLIPNHNEISVKESKATIVGDVFLFQIEKFGLSIEQRFFKRVFDITTSIIGLILLLPLILIVSIVIYINDGGNPFFVQPRITKGGKEFKLIKFRTMIPDAEKKTGPMLSVVNDKRITKLGSILRKTRIDEIPQLLNVLLGQMSIVGPRPERKIFVEKFIEEEKTYKYRHRVKAGITGYAQVKSNYDTYYKNKLKFDLFYIKRYSFWLDLKIIILTIRTIFKFSSTAGVDKNNDNFSIESWRQSNYIYLITNKGEHK